MIDSGNGRNASCPKQRANILCSAKPFLPRLKDVYENHFEIVPVKTRLQLEMAHRLRYTVYCYENAFENREDNPAGIERDAYDQHALHALLLHRPGRTPIGTVRLILPWPSDNVDLPIRTICRSEVLEHFSGTLPRTRIAEISRFAVTRAFRGLGAKVKSNNETRLRIVNASFGLMQAVIMMAQSASITHVCATMEPQLLRMLRRFGIYFEPLGPSVQYHGVRQPCFADLSELLKQTWIERRDIWEIITDNGRLWPLATTLKT